MIQYNFSEWLKNKQMLVEAQLVAGAVGNPFTYLTQKVGDQVYFGIHDIGKQIKETGSADQLNSSQIALKSGTIDNADPGKQLVFVTTRDKPYKYGYRSIKTRPMQDQFLTKIPVGHLLNITSLVDHNSRLQLGDNNLWLVIDGNTGHQKNIFQAISNAIRNKESAVDQGHSQGEGELEAAAKIRKQWIDQNKTANVEPPRTADQLFNTSPEPQYRLQGRQIMKIGDPEANRLRNAQRLAQLRGRNVPQSQGLDVASYDPTFTGYNRYWKTYVDPKQYDYMG